MDTAKKYGNTHGLLFITILINRIILKLNTWMAWNGLEAMSVLIISP